jgi:hypothetical protein
MSDAELICAYLDNNNTPFTQDERMRLYMLSGIDLKTDDVIASIKRIELPISKYSLHAALPPELQVAYKLMS